MREIEFRGYDGMDWIYGSAVQYEKDTDTWYMIENGAPDDDWVMVGEVGQFTGMKDKKGNKIYEGDILTDYKGLGEVKWVQEHSAFLVYVSDPAGYHYLESGNGQLTESEVIGNIFDVDKLNSIY